MFPNKRTKEARIKTRVVAYKNVEKSNLIRFFYPLKKNGNKSDFAKQSIFDFDFFSN